MELLQIKNLRFRYPDGTKALDGFSLDVAPGEVVAIVGPSGCGKSTLLATIAELQRPSAGSITWDQSLLTGPDHVFGRQMALLFQRDTVLPWKKVRKNVAFGMENLKVPRAERERRIDELLKMGGLEEFADVYPRVLSGGMRRRLALLMSMAVEPALLLLDEPFASLDEPTRVGLHADLLQTVYARNSAVILVTHDLAEAVSLADTVHILSPRPAHVSSSHRIPFGHDRDIFMLRATDEYNRIYQELWKLMWAHQDRAADCKRPSFINLGRTHGESD